MTQETQIEQGLIDKLIALKYRYRADIRDISPRRAMQQIVDYKNDPDNGYRNCSDLPAHRFFKITPVTNRSTASRPLKKQRLIFLKSSYTPIPSPMPLITAMCCAFILIISRAKEMPNPSRAIRSLSGPWLKLS